MTSTVTDLGYSATIRARLYRRGQRTTSGCLIYTGDRLPSGYGRISRGPRGAGVDLAHRVAWALEHGPIPAGHVVMHACDNPPCFNPEHLTVGTQSANLADAYAKGRATSPRGQDHPSSRLTDEQVAQLRHLVPAVGNYAELGRRFGITKQHARAVALGHRRTG